MPARIAKSLDEFRVRPNLNCVVIRGPVEEVLGKALEAPSETKTATPAKDRNKTTVKPLPERVKMS